MKTKAKQRTLITIMLLLLAISLLGCSREVEKHPPQESLLVWDQIADDWGAPSNYRYRGKEPRLVAVTDQASVSSLQGQLRPDHLEMVAKVDFSAYFVLVVYQGEKYTTGYSVKVTDIKRDMDTVLVYASFQRPSPGEVKGEIMTSPYCIVKVKKTEEFKGSFTFVLVANGEEVARQTYVVP